MVVLCHTLYPKIVPHTYWYVMCAMLQLVKMMPLQSDTCARHIGHTGVPFFTNYYQIACTMTSMYAVQYMCIFH